MWNRNVLLVDDEKEFIGTMSKRLAKRDFDILTAYSGEEALEMLDDGNTEVDVIILDVKMPVMDGIETLEQIKRKHPLKEVIMLTGHATVNSAIEGLRMGAFDFLMKPCEIDVLVSKVNEALKKRDDHENKIIEARMQDITRRRA